MDLRLGGKRALVTDLSVGLRFAVAANLAEMVAFVCSPVSSATNGASVRSCEVI